MGRPAPYRSRHGTPIALLARCAERRCCLVCNRDRSGENRVETAMSEDRPAGGVGHLWAIGYDDMTRATQVKEEITRLGWEETYLRLSDAAVVVRQPDGS